MFELASIPVIITIITAIVGALTWVYLRTRDIAKMVAEEVSETLEKRIDQAFNDILHVQTDLQNHKSNVAAQSKDFKDRFDKIDDTLSKLTVSNTKTTSEISHFVEISKLELKNTNDSIKRLEDMLKEYMKKGN